MNEVLKSYTSNGYITLATPIAIIHVYQHSKQNTALATPTSQPSNQPDKTHMSGDQLTQQPDTTYTQLAMFLTSTSKGLSSIFFSSRRRGVAMPRASVYCLCSTYSATSRASRAWRRNCRFSCRAHSMHSWTRETCTARRNVLQVINNTIDTRVSRFIQCPCLHTHTVIDCCSQS